MNPLIAIVLMMTFGCVMLVFVFYALKAINWIMDR